MAATVNLDHITFWSPPAGVGSKAHSHTEQNGQPVSKLGTDSTKTDEPIWILSDAESGPDQDDMTSRHGYQDVEDWPSDDTLPSINTLVASMAKTSTDNTGHTKRLGHADDMHRSGASMIDRPSQEVTMDTAMPRTLSPAQSRAVSVSTAVSQADEAGRCRAASSLGHVDFEAVSNAVAEPDDACDTHEHPSSAPPPLKMPEEEDIRADRRTALDVEDMTRRRIMTPRQSESPGGAATRCRDGYSGPRSNPNAGSSSDTGNDSRVDQQQNIPSFSPNPSARGGKRKLGVDGEVDDTSDDVGQTLRKRHKVSGTATGATSRHRSSPVTDRSEQDPVPRSTAETDISSSSRHGMRDNFACWVSSPGVDERGLAGKNSVDDSDDLDHVPCRRRKARESSTRAGRHRVRHPDHVAHAASPPSSGGIGDTGATAAKYGEWPLENVTLKRIILEGSAIFQLQFSWDPCVDGQLAVGRSSGGGQKCSAAKTKRVSRSSGSPVACLAFSPEEDNLLIKLKEDQGGLTWPEIHRRFSNTFPGRRSKGSLQVRYSTKLKGRREALSKGYAPQDQSTEGPRRSPRRPRSRVYGSDSDFEQSDDGIEDSDCFPMDRILGRSGRDLFFLRWSDNTTSWEPRSHILDERMLAEFEEGYRGFDEGVDILETQVAPDGLCKYRLHWHGRPSAEDAWVPEEQMDPGRVMSGWTGGEKGGEQSGLNKTC